MEKLEIGYEYLEDYLVPTKNKNLDSIFGVKPVHRIHNTVKLWTSIVCHRTLALFPMTATTFSVLFVYKKSQKMNNLKFKFIYFYSH